MRSYDFQVLTDPVSLKERWTLLSNAIPTDVAVPLARVDDVAMVGGCIISDPSLIGDLLKQASAARITAPEEHEQITLAWARAMSL
jgi:hypothetical protein